MYLALGKKSIHNSYVDILRISNNPHHPHYSPHLKNIYHIRILCLHISFTGSVIIRVANIIFNKYFTTHCDITEYNKFPDQIIPIKKVI